MPGPSPARREGDPVIVRDGGFAPEDFAGDIAPASQAAAANVTAVDLDPADDVNALAPHLDRLRLVRVAFPKFADGRGFTLARRLRAMGYAGRLRAAGHVLPDQYAMARRSGFDEVEIDGALAARLPQEHWIFRADWRAGDYQARLRG